MKKIISINGRILALLRKSRAKNALKDEVIIEVLGKNANTFCYQRDGKLQKIAMVWNRFLGWMRQAKNPKIICAKGEAIVVRVGADKSFLVSKDGVVEIPNEDWFNLTSKNK